LSATKGRLRLEVLLITALPGLVCLAHHSAAGLNEQGHHFVYFD